MYYQLAVNTQGSQERFKSSVTAPKFDARIFDGTINLVMNREMAYKLAQFINESEVDNHETYLWSLQNILMRLVQR